MLVNLSATSPRRFGGDWELGDLPMELVRDPIYVVSSCG